MSDIAICVEGLGKKFRIGSREPYHRLSETMTGLVRRSFELPGALARRMTGRQYLRDLSQTDEPEQDFWALQDVSFDVMEGEVVGIIGRNGAGKSTLLKVLSRITEPTTGRFGVRGRVGSLLEVGTGFHPELTGRENVYLSGMILGMTHHEVKRHFDEIAGFAEIDQFLDTPVKRYSSGMKVRLGFAVAAHLKPEILIVDEVLAVGDAEFQRKCVGKMEDIAEHGRTVLFVSHNMGAIATLCSRSVLLELGRVKRLGNTAEVIDDYFQQSAAMRISFRDLSNPPGDKAARLIEAEIECNGNPDGTCPISEAVAIKLTYELLQDDLEVFPNIHVTDSEGRYVFVASDSTLDPECQLKKSRGKYTSVCTIPANMLNDCTYYFGVALTSRCPIRVHFFEKQALRLRIVDPIVGTITRPVKTSGAAPGAVRPALDWECARLT